jgi:hypothetical protein
VRVIEAETIASAAAVDRAQRLYGDEIKRWSVDLSANDYSPRRERLSQLLGRGALCTISLKSRPG